MARAEGQLRCSKEPFIEEVAPCRIKSIQFSTLSGDEIRKMGEVQVWTTRMYDDTYKPVQNGLLDLRMGPAHKKAQCSTCHGDFSECPGHFGYLKLVRPVFNVGFFSNILDILKCICKSCSRVLLPPKDRLEFLRKMRNPKADALQRTTLMKNVRDKCKSTCCPWCGQLNGVVKRYKNEPAVLHDLTKIPSSCMEELHSAASHKKEKTTARPIYLLDPSTVLSLFRKILDEDCELLNLGDRPEKLLITEIAVPPLTIRPSGLVGTGRTSNEDSITSILKETLRWNASLRNKIDGGQPPEQCFDEWKQLQSKLVQYINSDAPSLPPDSKDRGFLQRLKGKQGRFRGNLSGKRVEYTGRTVISPDPNLKINEVAVPVLMARVLTFPERVSFHNIEKLRQRVRNGPTKHPGANFIRFPDGSMKNLNFGDKKASARELQYGDIVERHLEDGDVVLFNRQPSLHRMSIMSHRARIMPWRTLRFNESVCNPYNADFDGDEMNMHVPQTEEARTEALMLMGVQNNLCTAKNGEILVASTQDFLTSSFLITRKDTFYDRSTFALICSYMGDAMENIDLPTPALIKPVELWTGKQIFSVLVRPNARTRVFLNLIVMEKSYTKGKETMCPKDGYVYFRNSELICGQLGKATLGNGNKVGIFSVLLRDYNSHAAATCMNRLAKLSARWIGNHGFSIGIDDVQPGEHLIQEKAKEIDGGYMKCHDLFSSFTKGQLTLKPGCNAAQTLEAETTGVLNEIRDNAGKVCMKELHWRNSPLIMSQCGSKGSPTNISQMVVCVGQQSVGGRRAPNGFIDRTLPHFPINSKSPAAKGFVANSFYSGLTATEFFFHTMGGREGLVDTAVKTAETGYMARQLMKGLEDVSVLYDQTVRNASGIIVQFSYGDDGLDPVKMEGKDSVPLNLEQLFMKVLATCPMQEQESLSPAEILNAVNKRLSEHDMSIEGGCSTAFRNQLLAHFNKQVELFRRTRRALNLNEEQVEGKIFSEKEKIAASISGLSLKQLKVFLETCINRYHLKRIEAGTAIGPIGAQSIAEPGTQMTLKTFHFAGVASMNVTLGVPRIREIMYAAKNIKTPIITATLQSDRDPVSAHIVKSSIEKTSLGEIAKAVKIVLKSSRPNIVVKLDIELIKNLHLGITADSVQMSILGHSKLKLKSENIRVIDYSKLRIYPPEVDRTKLLYHLHALRSMLPKVIVKGIPSIGRAIVNENKDDNGMKKFNLLVEGTSLLGVMGTPGVDGTKTNSNHVMEVQKTLGIEAARKIIIREIQNTMKSHGMSIDVRHMMLLADIMTYKGEVLGITRTGISKMKNSVLMLASFEKTGEHLFNASYSGRQDPIEGVSECIIMGIPMSAGTGILKVKQRVDHLLTYDHQPDPILGSG